jgi:diguanylate cyclase (GGDEF)-like protein
MDQLSQSISIKDVGIILEHIHAMVVLVECDGTLVSWNPAFDSYKKIFLLANKLQDYFSQKDKNQVVKKLVSKTKHSWAADILLNEEGQTLSFGCLLVPLSDERMLFIAEKIKSSPVRRGTVERLNRQVKLFRIESEFTKKLARNKQIELEAVMVQASEVSQIDALTFLINRRMIVRELQNEVLRAQRYNNPLSISVVDIDHFKNVNDTYGHLVGDESLRQVAYQLRDHIRHPDMAGRYGGEEFLILLPNSDSNAATEQASRLCKQVRENVIQVENHNLNITISIGIAQFRNGEDTWETLLKRADTAMYEAKHNGRDRWVIAS